MADELRIEEWRVTPEFAERIAAAFEKLATAQETQAKIAQERYDREFPPQEQRDAEVFHRSEAQEEDPNLEVIEAFEGRFESRYRQLAEKASDRT